MRHTRSRLALLGGLTLSLCVVVSLAAGGAAVAKKKGGSKAANVTGTAGAIPNGPSSFGSPFGFPTSNPVPFKGTATVGKKFKGKTVGDVDATVSMTGVSAAGTTCGGICDTVVRLTAPNGATTALLFGGLGGGGAGAVSGNLVSNLTLSDQTPTRTCADDGPATPPPPCGDPNATLLAPFTGTARPGGAALYLLNGSPMRGTWTLTAFDVCGSPTACPFAPDSGTASIVAWSLRITPARAPR